MTSFFTAGVPGGEALSSSAREYSRLTLRFTDPDDERGALKWTLERDAKIVSSWLFRGSLVVFYPGIYVLGAFWLPASRDSRGPALADPHLGRARDWGVTGFLLVWLYFLATLFLCCFEGAVPAQRRVRTNANLFYPLWWSMLLLAMGHMAYLSGQGGGAAGTAHSYAKFGREGTAAMCMFFAQAGSCGFIRPPFYLCMLYFVAVYAEWLAFDALLTDGIQPFWPLALLGVIAWGVIAVYNADKFRREAYHLTRSKVAKLSAVNRGLKRILALTKSQKEDVQRMVADLSKRMDARPLAFEDLLLKRKLGAGSFGDVWLADYARFDITVAVKKLKSEQINKPTLAKFQEEIALMARIDHGNIVGYYGMCWEEPHLCLVLEFVNGGSLKEILASDRKKGDSGEARLTWETHKFKLAIGVTAALKYLHFNLAPKIIHRDIKSDNVLVSHRYVPKVADFGESREHEGGAATMTFVGTPYFLAPEIMRGDAYNEKCDVYSFGILLLEMTLIDGSLRDSVFPDLGGHGAMTKVAQGWTPAPAAEFAAAYPGINKIIKACLTWAPDERPTSAEVWELLVAAMLRRATRNRKTRPAMFERCSVQSRSVGSLLFKQRGITDVPRRSSQPMDVSTGTRGSSAVGVPLQTVVDVTSG